MATTGATERGARAAADPMAEVAHDLRNPLTSVSLAIETLKTMQDEPPDPYILSLLERDVARIAARLDAATGASPGGTGGRCSPDLLPGSPPGPGRGVPR